MTAWCLQDGEAAEPFTPVYPPFDLVSALRRLEERAEPVPPVATVGGSTDEEGDS